MSYRSIFTVLTDQSLVGMVLEHAIEAALAHDAHLEVLCLGVDRSQAGYYFAGTSAVVLQDTIARATEEANEIKAMARDMLVQPALRWCCETGVTQMADLGRHIATRARFSDLVILPKPYGNGRKADIEAATEAALFDGHTPTYVVPDGHPPQINPREVIVAWNESAEALKAVRAALPLLTQADRVHVVVVDPPSHGPSRSDPGGLLAHYLARHDIKAEIDVLSRTLPRISDVLLRHAMDKKADLIVMGAYGHSRFREAVFGGATRYMLEEADLPVLMAH